MAKREMNSDIKCNVCSCAFHCKDDDFCSLKSIHVDACPGCSSGDAKDESMCGSYKHM